MSKFAIYFIALVLVALVALPSYAQKSGRHKKRRGKAIACPIFVKEQYPYHGIGFKLGDPFAITYKFYLNEHFGIALDAGKASSGLYSRYYRQQFDIYAASDTLSDNSEMEYLTHRVKADWIVTLKFLWHIDAKGITPGLRIYGGVGMQTKLTKLQYQFLHTANGNANTIGTFDKKYGALGPQFSMGIEYSYFQIPISAFMELELFNDIRFDPGTSRFGGGAGLRYVF